VRRTPTGIEIIALRNGQAGTGVCRDPFGLHSEAGGSARFMADVVVKLPVHDGEEAQLFGSFLSSFIEQRCSDAERWAADNDEPYLMVRSDPQANVEVKVLTFQEGRVANAFSQGWAQAKVELAGRLAYLLGQ
jgi:hypothetical protein